MTEGTQPASVVSAPVSLASSEPPLRGLRMWALIADIVAAAAVVVSLTQARLRSPSVVQRG